jgi:hypothetical protein
MPIRLNGLAAPEHDETGGPEATAAMPAGRLQPSQAGVYRGPGNPACGRRQTADA